VAVQLRSSGLSKWKRLFKHTRMQGLGSCAEKNAAQLCSCQSRGIAHMGIQRTLARSSLQAGRYLQLRHKTISASGSADAIAKTSNTDTITRQPGAAFPGDLRSTSGLGLGDEIESHTGKWMTVRSIPACTRCLLAAGSLSAAVDAFHRGAGSRQEPHGLLR